VRPDLLALLSLQSLALEDITYCSLANVDLHAELVLSTGTEALSPAVLHAADVIADAPWPARP